MKNKIYILMIGFALLAFPFTAQTMTLSFDFEGEANNGIGSATMLFEGLGDDTWTVTINNTSPLTTSTGGDNAPAIVGFGFDFIGGDGINSRSLFATPEGGGSSVDLFGLSGDSEWSLDPNVSIGSITLDLFGSNAGGVKGGLYNPASLPAARAADPNFFTTAILTINWNEDADLVVFTETDPPDGSPFVRMQNVGDGGAGSLKLFVPEPASMLLVGIGLIGLATVRRRKWFKKNL